MRIGRAGVGVAIAATALAAGLASRGQAAQTGFFSQAQVEAGKATYEAKCAACHGETLQGETHAPALTGDYFWSNWSGKPVRALYSRMISTMPLDDPGSMTEEEVLGVVSYALATNGMPAGPSAVTSANTLNTITLEQPAAK